MPQSTNTMIMTTVPLHQQSEEVIQDAFQLFALPGTDTYRMQGLTPVTIGINPDLWNLWHLPWTNLWSWCPAVVRRHLVISGCATMAREFKIDWRKLSWGLGQSRPHGAFPSTSKAREKRPWDEVGFGDVLSPHSLLVWNGIETFVA